MIEFNKSSINNYYHILEEIGSGQFATVRRCIEKSTAKEYAAKFIRKKRVTGSRRGVILEDIQREVNILQKLNHQNIVKLYNVYDNGHDVILILELVRGGELFDFISDSDGLSESETIELLKQILLGLKHMHKKNIVHLDLKPENIMLLEKNTKSLKLIDFGLSRVVNSGSEIREIMGTPEFVAPEIINYEPITLATDLWSVGVIIYNLLSGASPFLGDSKQETFSNITAVDYYCDSDCFSPMAKDFIQSLLQRDERKRLTVEECLNHPWLNQTMVIIPNPLINKTVTLVANPTMNKPVTILPNPVKKPNISYSQAHIRWKNSLEIVKLCNQLSLHFRNVQRKSQSVNSLTNSFQSKLYVKEENDENFVLAALFGAVEEANLNGLNELLTISKIDINQANRHGETAVHIAAGLGQLSTLKFLVDKGADIDIVDNRGDTAIFWAARQGHLKIIRYLYELGMSVDLKNKAGETAVHVAARYGHAEALEQLCRCGANVNIPDDHGETALHIAVWHGFSKIVHILGEVGALGNVKNKDEETPLHCAAARGHVESVRCLLEIGVDLNLLDKKGYTALHLALRRHHIVVALMLINGGCNFEISDAIGERAIHIVSREGLFLVCQLLCSLCCNVNVCNKSGLYPIHLAAKNGHIDIIRCLCLTNCLIEQKNRDGITAEISALAQGHKNIADLLKQVKIETFRNDLLSQFVPSNQVMQRVKLKLLGHSGVGKSTLIETLKCGYLSSWFRRSSRKPSMTSLTMNGKRKSTSTSSSKSSLDSSPPLTPISNSKLSLTTHLEFSSNSDISTKGIEVHQMSLSGACDLSVWDFSGSESYFQIYDHFLNENNCIHAILFRICDRLDVQIKQVLFWLYFLQSRLTVIEPFSFQGKSSRSAKVVLIATHSDTATHLRNTSNSDHSSSQVNSVLQIVNNKFATIFDIYQQVLIMDANCANSSAIKQLKNYISSCKLKLIEGVASSNGFLELILTTLQSWRKMMSTFPVLTSNQFITMVREQINPLAGENHIKDVIMHLTSMGEILYLNSKGDQDLIIIEPNWLTSYIFGKLFSNDHICSSPITGRYSVDTMQEMFPEIDALDLLQVLESYGICTQCDVEGDIEYEFPSFIKLEKPDNLLEALEKNKSSEDDYKQGGLRLQCEPDVPSGFLLTCLFPRIQNALRASVQENSDNGQNLDIVQWCNASKLTFGSIEAIIMAAILTSSMQYEAIEIRVRGLFKEQIECFYFFEDLLSLIEMTINEICPSLLLERHYISPLTLHQHKEDLITYSPSQIIRVATSSNDPLNQFVQSYQSDTKEKMSEIISFGCNDLTIDVHRRFSQNLNINSKHRIDSNVLGSSESQINPTLVSQLHIDNLSITTKQRLCSILDPPDPLGKDWCMLGIKLGLTDKLPKLDPGASLDTSPTWRVLEECRRNKDCTISLLIKTLQDLNRNDAITLILNCAPILKVCPLFSNLDKTVSINDESPLPISGTSSASQASSSNLSR